MSGTITTGNHPAALWPGVHKFVMGSYNEHPTEYSKIFSVEKSNMAYEEDVETSGFGLAGVKAEGTPTSYDSHQQGGTVRYRHIAYSLGYVVTREEKDDNLYKSKSFKRGKQLSLSFRTTKEIVHANILNRGFDAAYTGGTDGVELFSTAHPTLSGNQSNTLAVAADLSEAALEDMLIDIMDSKNSRGLQIAVKDDCLIIPTALSFEAERIVKSNLRVGTDFNDINAMKSMGLLPGGIVANHYLTDADAWFVKTNVESGLTSFQRKGFEFTKDNDFDTDNAKAKGYERYSVGWTDWRGVFGSPGA
ncbi:MAG: hypothetical protein AAF438_16950 [Pseudomonadota bacterium]